MDKYDSGYAKAMRDFEYLLESLGQVSAEEEKCLETLLIGNDDRAYWNKTHVMGYKNVMFATEDLELDFERAFNSKPEAAQWLSEAKENLSNFSFGAELVGVGATATGIGLPAVPFIEGAGFIASGLSALMSGIEDSINWNEEAKVWLGKTTELQDKVIKSDNAVITNLKQFESNSKKINDDGVTAKGLLDSIGMSGSYGIAEGMVLEDQKTLTKDMMKDLTVQRADLHYTSTLVDAMIDQNDWNIAQEINDLTDDERELVRNGGALSRPLTAMEQAYVDYVNVIGELAEKANISWDEAQLEYGSPDGSIFSDFTRRRKEIMDAAEAGRVSNLYLGGVRDQLDMTDLTIYAGENAAYTRGVMLESGLLNYDGSIPGQGSAAEIIKNSFLDSILYKYGYGYSGIGEAEFDALKGTWGKILGEEALEGLNYDNIVGELSNFAYSMNEDCELISRSLTATEEAFGKTVSAVTQIAFGFLGDMTGLGSAIKPVAEAAGEAAVHFTRPKRSGYDPRLDPGIPSSMKVGTTPKPIIRGFDPSRMYASGTTYSVDTFIAGEYGPELIMGAQGSTVFPNSETQKIVSAVYDSTAYNPPAHRLEAAPLNVPVPQDFEAGRTGETNQVRMEKKVVLELFGSGSLNVSGGYSDEEMWARFGPSLKQAFLGLLSDEVMEEGDMSYGF